MRHRLARRAADFLHASCREPLSISLCNAARRGTLETLGRRMRIGTAPRNRVVAERDSLRRQRGRTPEPGSLRAFSRAGFSVSPTTSTAYGLVCRKCVRRDAGQHHMRGRMCSPEARHTSFRFALLPGFDSGLDCLELNASRFEVVVGNFPGKRLEFPCVPAAAEMGMQFFD
jgi:hypothetical protein